ncbi:MAG: hypothetical protein U1A78_01145 [Polyangia bacterium]
MDPRRAVGLGLGGLLLVALTFVLGRGLQRREPPSPPAAFAIAATEPFPLAVCRGRVRHVEVELRGELQLHRGLLDPAPRSGLLSDGALQAAVQQQLRYAFASTQHDAPHTLTPAGPLTRVERLAAREVRYGRDLRLDWPSDPEVRPTTDYVRRALARGQLSASDPALQLEYRAAVTVAWCLPPGASEPGPLTLPAPRDPYLLHWFVEPAQRARRVYGKKSAVTFPCAREELADYDHPEFLWYRGERTKA